jgi:hypothetical protein
MTDLLKLLHDERAAIAHRLAALDTAIKALNGNSVNVATVKAVAHKKRTMSAATRAKISAAAKKRWAKIKK